MSREHDEKALLRSPGLQNASTIVAARQSDEQELRRTREALERRTEELAGSERALREETRVLELLNRASAEIASQLDLHKLVQSATDIATQMSGAAFGAFFYNAPGDQDPSLVLYTLSGAPREAFEHLGHPRATALFGATFRGEAAVRSADVLEDARYGGSAPHHGMPAGHLPVRSYLAVPVIARSGAVIGGLFLGHPEPDVFSERTERAIVTLAVQVAVAIDNARLYEAVIRSAEQRQQALDAERLARLEVERVSVMKDEFLATLSHELRTPLSAILGWSQALLQGSTSPDRIARGLEAISRNAHAQAQLIHDLLDMSAVVCGNMRLDVRPTDLASVVDAAIESVRPTAEAKDIRIERTIDSVAGPVQGDPARLQQIVWNLLSNAMKFTPRGGCVSVVLARVGSHVELTVADTGTGISAEFLPLVFDRFRQADATTTRRFGGLGLGLAIVKQLVELHGGTVQAESAGEGAGATFTVALPVAQLSHREPSDQGKPRGGSARR